MAASERSTPTPPSWRIESVPGQPPVLILSGSWTGDDVPRLWRAMQARLTRLSPGHLAIDTGDLLAVDAMGQALLEYLGCGAFSDAARPPVVEWRGDRRESSSRIPTLEAEEFRRSRHPQPVRGHLAADLGKAAVDACSDLRDMLTFVGASTVHLAGALRQPRHLRPREILRILEKAGANALPIISLISLLVGLILAFESAQPMRMFGAEIFIADMIGLIMVRELGPLMTAILLAGRSGSAFAAEIGTMKVNEELNALETMGLDPIRFLVVPRLLASLLLTPLLAVYSMVMGVTGGIIVLLLLRFPLSLIVNQLTKTLNVGDITVGVTKGIVFGWIVAAMGCLRGLQTRQGPSAVGESTTRAVVSGILLLILADALFSVVLYALKP